MRRIAVFSMMGLVATTICLRGAAAAESKKAGPGKLKIGDTAPEFEATTVDGKAISLKDTKGAKVVVLAFTCNKCPVAVAYESRFIEFTKTYEKKDVKFIALNVNKTENLKIMKARAEEKDFNFPYAYDESGKSATAYRARVTPHLFVIDGDRKVAYIGSFDDNMVMKKVTKNYVRDAVDALLAGKKPETTTTPEFGCTIKR